jgi:hypothetical protein
MAAACPPGGGVAAPHDGASPPGGRAVALSRQAVATPHNGRGWRDEGGWEAEWRSMMALVGGGDCGSEAGP